MNETGCLSQRAWFSLEETAIARVFLFTVPAAITAVEFVDMAGREITTSKLV